jgi:hypothetical protein
MFSIGKAVRSLVAAGVMLTCTATYGQAGAGNGSSPTGGPSTAAWGAFWYAASRTMWDDVTWVEGGAHGSAFVAMKAPFSGTTTWILLDGDDLYLRQLGGDPDIVTTIVGQSVTSRQYGIWDDTAVDVDRPWLNYEILIPLAEDFEIRHTPFLTGYGWTGAGASRDEAKDIIESMGLTMQVIGSNAVGHVSWQSPSPGIPLSAGAVVQVVLDGVVPVPTSALGGDSPDSAFAVENVPDPQSFFRRMTEQNTNGSKSGGPTPACGDDRDLFWKLPKEWEGHSVTASWKNNAKQKVTLSAWSFDGTQWKELACNCATQPTVTIDQPGKCEVFVVADSPPDGVPLEIRHVKKTVKER